MFRCIVLLGCCTFNVMSCSFVLCSILITYVNVLHIVKLIYTHSRWSIIRVPSVLLAAKFLLQLPSSQFWIKHYYHAAYGTPFKRFYFVLTVLLQVKIIVFSIWIGSISRLSLVGHSIVSFQGTHNLVLLKHGGGTKATRNCGFLRNLQLIDRQGKDEI